MTSQIPDMVDIERRRYGLAGVNGATLWYPHVVGVAPKPIHTACWRGYICT